MGNILHHRLLNTFGLPSPNTLASDARSGKRTGTISPGLILCALPNSITRRTRRNRERTRSKLFSASSRFFLRVLRVTFSWLHCTPDRGFRYHTDRAKESAHKETEEQRRA